jgi:hypothetical protein
VTEFAIRPLLRHFVPPLANLRQPLSGLVGLRRSAVDPAWLGDGYAAVGLLLSAYFAGCRIVEVDLGRIIHHKRADTEKTKQADNEVRTLLRIVEERQRHQSSDAFQEVAYPDRMQLTG